MVEWGCNSRGCLGFDSDWDCSLQAGVKGP